jgi:dihydropteroate synthase
MGIVNLTHDSFYEGSRFLDPGSAADKALELQSQGAAILDFGAESTRPGSVSMDPAEEIRRLVPALRLFRRQSDGFVSIDTRHASVARACLDEGADLINDISGLGDAEMASVVATHGAGLVLMHMQGQPSTMQQSPHYEDCATEVRDFLMQRLSLALDQGVHPRGVVLDPGIGFGKTLTHNLDLLSRLHLLTETGYPVLVGLSRKRFIGELTGRDVQDRLAGSIGAACAAYAKGAAIFRVHDVAPTLEALKVVAAVLKEER